MNKSELLNKFFSNACSPEEAEEALKHLHEHPELMEQYLPVQEWNNSSDEHNIPVQHKFELEKHILENTRPKNTVVKLIRISVAAAALAGLIFSGVHLYNNAAIISAPQQVAAQKQKSVFKNVTNHDYAFMLKDGSIVTLTPGSEIEYEHDFNQHKRDIILRGDGLFAVKKDKSKPFTVIANGISTTALGTKFYIKTTELGHVRVTLKEGKVVVRSRNIMPEMEDIYLFPGQQCKVSLHAKTAVVFATKKGYGRDTNKHTNAETFSLTFAQTPIQEVLENINKAYHNEVHFNRQELKGLYFTGQILKDDSLSRTLEIICEMNQLKLTKKNSKGDQMHYSIEKNNN